MLVFMPPTRDELICRGCVYRCPKRKSEVHSGENSVGNTTRNTCPRYGNFPSSGNLSPSWNYISLLHLVILGSANMDMHNVRFPNNGARAWRSLFLGHHRQVGGLASTVVTAANIQAVVQRFCLESKALFELTLVFVFIVSLTLLKPFHRCEIS